LNKKVIEVSIEVKTKAWTNSEADKIFKEINDFVLSKGYQLARKGSGQGSRSSLLHPIGTLLS